eukprot:COSAG03_NODE_6140_length_1108_cov_1.353816_2_plen_138_part_01
MFGGGGGASDAAGDGQPKGEEPNLFGIKVPAWLMGDDGAAQQQQQQDPNGFGYASAFGNDSPQTRYTDQSGNHMNPAPAQADYSQYYNQQSAGMVQQSAVVAAPPTAAPASTAPTTDYSAYYSAAAASTVAATAQAGA